LVNINLLQAGSSTPVLSIAQGIPDNGEYDWTIPESLTPANNYVVQITRADDATVTGASNRQFIVAPPVHVFYINDGTVQPGDWTTAPGDDNNDGLTPATPMASLSALFQRYQFHQGDVIKVDNGVYSLSTNILIAAGQSGLTIQ